MSLLQCTKCQQPALVAEHLTGGPQHDWPDCECRTKETILKCLACSAEERDVSAMRIVDAQEAEEDFRGVYGNPRHFWEERLARERAKVERLKQGRW